MKRTDGLSEEFPFPSWYLVMALRETIEVYKDTLFSWLNVCRGQYGVKIRLITSFKDTCFIEIVPTKEKSPRGLTL